MGRQKGGKKGGGKKGKKGKSAKGGNNRGSSSGGNGKQTRRNAKTKRRQRYGEQELCDFKGQLAAEGLYVVKCQGDGNCLFRSISFQLFGTENNHCEVRDKVCNFLDEHEADFSPFVEDDEEFEDYLARMREDGTWGGNIEICAAARLYRCAVQVYRLAEPSFLVSPEQNEGLCDGRILRLSYHGGDHYNALRSTTASEPLLEPSFEPPNAAPQQERGRERSASAVVRDVEEQRIVEATGCNALQHVRRRLADANGNVDCAIEQLLKERDEGADWELGFADEAPATTAAEKRRLAREARAAKKLEKQKKKDDRKRAKERSGRLTLHNTRDEVSDVSEQLGTISI